MIRYTIGHYTGNGCPQLGGQKALGPIARAWPILPGASAEVLVYAVSSLELQLEYKLQRQFRRFLAEHTRRGRRKKRGNVLFALAEGFVVLRGASDRRMGESPA